MIKQATHKPDQPARGANQAHAAPAPDGNAFVSVQRSLGNQALRQLIGRQLVQAKLTVSDPDDIYEQEADRVADEVTRMPEPPESSAAPDATGRPPRIQRLCSQCKEEVQRKTPLEEEEPLVQKKLEDAGPERGASRVGPYVDSLSGRGEPLTPATRAFMEPRFGADFSRVRIHTDPDAHRSAEAISALAYTSGSHIVFRAGQYDASSESGKRLLAHELTHVVQQGATPPVHGVESARTSSVFPGEPAFQVQRLPAPMIQRAEVDDNPANCFPPGGKRLVDSKDTVNGWIAAAMNTANRRQIDAAGQVYQDLGSGGSTNKSEKLLAALPASQVRHVEFSRSRYSGTSLWKHDPLTQGILTIAGKVFVAPLINLCGVCIGTDKVGHFFQQGYEYYRLAQAVRIRVDNMSPEEKDKLYARLTGSLKNAPQLDPDQGGAGTLRIEFSPQAMTDFIADAYTHEFGNWLEGFNHKLSQEDVRWIKGLPFIPFYYGEGVYGQASTGVLSRADLQANRQGYQFYRDIFHDPSHTPDICGYVGELWNERSELNTFDPRLGTPSGPASSSSVAEEP